MSFPLKELGSCKYEISLDSSKGMRVPGIIYANEVLKKGIEGDESLNQVVNVSKLPGIINASIAMPDIHLGYGFPIGGVAAFDLDNGVISPGGVGYDINCLRGDSRLLDSFGAWKTIDRLTGGTILGYERITKCQKENQVLLTMYSSKHKEIMLVRTECGKELFVTPDHPIMTESGMTETSRLKVGERIVVKGFEGIEFTKPSSRVVISREILIATMDRLGIPNKGSGRGKLLAHLSQLSLIDLRLDNPKVSVFLKLTGLIFGGGTIQNKSLKVKIRGERENLEEVKKDLAILGIPADIFSGKRGHQTGKVHGSRKVEQSRCSLNILSKGFGLLLVALGVPVGERSLKPYPIPDWLMETENWQKRLFLASFFGVEMTAPRSVEGTDFSAPTISINKHDSISPNAAVFLSQIAEMLNQLGVTSSITVKTSSCVHHGMKEERMSYSLHILPTIENLIKFYSTISYEYNKNKSFLSGLASLYLAKVLRVKTKEDPIGETAISTRHEVRGTDMVLTLSADKESSKYSAETGRPTKVERERGAMVVLSDRFDEFIQKSAISRDFAYDKIEEISSLPFDGEVYDLTVNDPDHNFVANGIVVSNCGVRLVRTDLTASDMGQKVRLLIDSIFENVPSGVGREGRLKISKDKIEGFLSEGVKGVVDEGFGWSRDTERIEEGGTIAFADRSKISQKARERGFPQLGSLGAGNHFLEVQLVDKIYDTDLAKKFGLFSVGQVTVMVHTGSRGFGHQVATDYLEVMDNAMKKYNLSVPDKQLASAPFLSKEAQDYVGAMGGAANFGFSNRQIITHWIRESFRSVLNRDPEEMGMDILYDVSHNIAKVEEHEVDGKNRTVIVHRKGATRAFPAGRRELPTLYKETGHPVIIPGTMGTASYVLVGTPKALADTFGSTCHGSGRVMSRSRAVRQYTSQGVSSVLESKGIYVRAATKYVLQEEAPMAYKDVDQVVKSVECAEISRIVARLKPIGVMKG